VPSITSVIFSTSQMIFVAVEAKIIALAAIKELKAQKDAEINELKEKIKMLAQRIDALTK